MARVQERHLSNGLRCVAVDMPWLTVAGASLWFRAGQHSADTAKLQTAHLLEHLCMRGPDGDPTKFALSLELQGALFNAVVHREWTMFAGRAPVSSFDMDLRIAVDRLWYRQLVRRPPAGRTRGYSIGAVRRRSRPFAPAPC